MKKVCFVVKSLEISGGIYVVLQHALFMKRCGLDVTIANSGAFDGIPDWHPAIGELRFRPLDALASERFDLAVATWWSTAYDLHKLDAAKYLYFVQLADYLAQPAHLRGPAERTYGLGLDAITVAAKLGEELSRDYGMTALVALNGIDKDVFSTSGLTIAPRRGERLRVLVEGPLGARNKSVAYAIGLAKRALADEIWLLTASNIAWYPGVDRVFSRLNATQCASVYRSCDVLLKLSTLESCCLPNLEMFHCGGTVIAYDIPGPNEYLVHNENALILPVGDEAGVIEAVQALKTSPELLATLQAGARATARSWPTWEQSSATFLRHCQTLMQKPGPSREELRQKSVRESSPSQPRSPFAEALRTAAALLDKRGRMNELRTLLRAVLIEEREAPRPVMQERAAQGRSAGSAAVAG